MGRWQVNTRSTLTDLDPKELRPLLHRVALRLELEEVSPQLDAGFDADRAGVKLARLPEIIREARTALRLRAAP